MTHRSRIPAVEAETSMPRDLGGRTLAFSLVESIGRAVVRGAYTDRDFPSEGDLAKGCGVSLSVIREATKMLAAKGLLGSVPQRGTFVLSSEHWNLFDTDVLRWLVELREPTRLLRQLRELCSTIEPEGAALAAQHANPAQVSEIAEELESVATPCRFDAYALDAALGFRLAVLRATNNPFFRNCSKTVAASFTTAQRCANRIEMPHRNCANFEAVLNAIAIGDPDTAQDGMRKLIDDEFRWIDDFELRRRCL